MSGVGSSTLTIESNSSALATARRQVRRLEGEWFQSELVDTAVLLTNELVANAMLHGGAKDVVHLRMNLTSEILWVGVTQPLAFVKVAAANGWGLRLVEELSDRWGAEAQSDGTTIVFFELRRDGGS